MTQQTKHLYEFGPYRIDPAKRLLLRGSESVPLPSKAFETLLVLVQHSKEVVAKDHLMKVLWPDSFVEESNLSQSIFLLRKALGETAQDHRYIVTIPGRGYRFAEQVEEISEETGDLIGESRPQSGVTIEEENLPNLLPPPKTAGGSVRLLALFAGLAILAAAGYLSWRHFRGSVQNTHGRIMLAVLPFQNLTGDPEQEYFADGLTEELIAHLGRLYPEQLGVIARTSVMGYKHSDKRLDQIGRELSVQYVLEGSVRQAADRLRITAELITVTDQSHLWAENYDRKPEDILAVQDDVASAVARETQLRLTPGKTAQLAGARTVDPEAYEAYLKGRYFWNKRTAEGLQRGIELFQRATAKDPKFAAAYAGLADCYSILGSDVLPAGVAQTKAQAAARKALELDPGNAEGHAALALVKFYYQWDWKQSGEEFRRAIELNPNYATAHQWYSYYLTAMSRFADAIEEAKTAQKLDPLSLSINTTLAGQYYSARQYDRAIEQNRKTQDLDPNYVPAHVGLGRDYEQKRMWEQALAELGKAVELSQGSPTTLAGLGHAYGVSGQRAEGRKIAARLQELSKQQYVSAFETAIVFVALGDNDGALRLLERAYQERESQLPFVRIDPRLDPLRSDPRFQDLLRRIGLPG